ncbi:MAG: CsbD family protein [Caulobacteraceae bacterium]
MTEDRFEGAAKKGLGQIQGGLGGALGDSDLEAKGQVNEVIGNVQEFYGKAVDTVKDATDQLEQLVDEEPYKALALAVAAGVVLGFLLGRGGRKVVYVRG